MFANPVAPPKVLPQRDILRFLRLITSPAYRREPQRLPLSVVAAMCGVSRLALYRILWLDRVSDEMAEVLTPIVRAHEAGKLRCRACRAVVDGSIVAARINTKGRITCACLGRMKDGQMVEKGEMAYV